MRSILVFPFHSLLIVAKAMKFKVSILVRSGERGIKHLVAILHKPTLATPYQKQLAS